MSVLLTSWREKKEKSVAGDGDGDGTAQFGDAKHSIDLNGIPIKSINCSTQLFFFLFNPFLAQHLIWFMHSIGIVNSKAFLQMDLSMTRSHLSNVSLFNLLASKMSAFNSSSCNPPTYNLPLAVTVALYS